MSQTWSDRHRILLVTRARQRLKNWGVSAGAMAAIALAWTPGIPHDRFDRTTSHQAIKPSIAWFERFERRTQSIHKSITFDSVDSYIFYRYVHILWTSLLSCRDACLLVTTDKTLSKTAGTVIVDDGGTLGLHDIAPHPAATFHQSRSVQFVKATCRGYSRSSMQMATVTLSCTFEP
jgi:hypothetical protein